MIYLYGLLELGASVDALCVDEMPEALGTLDFVEVGPARLICGRDVPGPIRAKRRNLLAHARVLEGCAEIGTVLPMRFGMTESSLEAVADRLEPCASEVAREFDRLRDREEIGVRVSYPKEPALEAALAADPTLARERDRLLSQTAPDRMQAAEFGRRIAERLERRRTDAQHAILVELGHAWLDQVVLAPEDDTQVLSADVLLRKGCRDRLAAEVERAAKASSFAPGSEPSVRIIGPMPPYSFVRLTLGEPEDVAA